MYKEIIYECEDCELHGITDWAKDVWGTVKETGTEIIQDLPAIYEQQKQKEAQEKLLKKQYLAQQVKIKAELEAKKKELLAMEARKVNEAAQAQGVKSPAGMTFTAEWVKENAVFFTLGIAAVGLILRMRETR